MAELTQKEHLQPSLLDRLIDDEPFTEQESRDKRVLSMHKLRESVVRDVSWLINADSLASVTDLSDFPEVAKSVINYGIKELAGRTVAGVSLLEIEKGLKQAILKFEPRILPNSLQIQLHSSEEMNQRAIRFDIEGYLWSQPLPLHIYLQTEIDTITGDVKLHEMDS